MNILLIGLRASGKSTVGARLAALLDRTFIELDGLTVARFPQTSVRDVWATHGEDAWRNAEADTLAECLAGADQVIALGGGTPMIDAACGRIEAEQADGRAKVVYLQCDVATLAQRLRQTPGDRPSLTGADPVEEVAAVAAAREPVFRRIADVEIDVAQLGPEELARLLVDRLS